MDEQFAVSIAQWENFQFLIDFNQDGVTDLLTDEPEPVGVGKGPSPARVLAAAVGNCLASSLLFCLKRAQVETTGLACTVSGQMVRNEKGRLRIRELNVQLNPSLDSANFDAIQQCASVFEDFCVVAESVREGIAVTVQIAPVEAGPTTLTPM